MPIRLPKDYPDKLNKLQDAMVRVLLAWTELENSLLYLLTTITNSEWEVAKAIFYASDSPRTRLLIVKHAGGALISKMPNAEQVNDLLANLYDRIDTQKRARDMVAHGSIKNVATRGTYRVCIAPSTHDPRFFQQMSKPHRAGKTANDLNQTAKQMDAMCKELEILNQLITAWREHDHATYSQKLAKLDSQRRTRRSGGEPKGAGRAR